MLKALLVNNIIPANPETSEIGTNGRTMLNKSDIPEFPIHYYMTDFFVEKNRDTW